MLPSGVGWLKRPLSTFPFWCHQIFTVREIYCSIAQSLSAYEHAIASIKLLYGEILYCRMGGLDQQGAYVAEEVVAPCVDNWLGTRASV